MKRIKDAFEKPFRSSTSNTLPFPSQSQNQADTPANIGRRVDKGKQRAEADVAPRPPREPSPVWDIELDLDVTPPPSPLPAQDKPDTSRKRPSSPVWDIELNLNDSDLEDSSRKRHKGDDDGFGTTDLLQ